MKISRLGGGWNLESELAEKSRANYYTWTQVFPDPRHLELYFSQKMTTMAEQSPLLNITSILLLFCFYHHEEPRHSFHPLLLALFRCTGISAGFIVAFFSLHTTFVPIQQSRSTSIGNNVRG
jgi:hypothetical protein